MGQSIIFIIVIIYFIREQFDFNTVKKLNYFFLPLLSLYSFIVSFSLSWVNMIVLVIIIVSSLFIGHFQSIKTIVRIDSVPVYYFYDDDDKEHKIYKKVVKVKGGRNYLIGWIAIFVIQIIVQVLTTKHSLSSEYIVDNFVQDVFEEILSLYRVLTFDENPNAWYVWALYGASSLSYTYFLAKKSPMVRGQLFSSKKKNRYDFENM